MNDTTEEHDILAPSSSSRWLRCHASVQLIQRLALPDTAGAPAQWGTDSHLYLKQSLTLGMPPQYLVKNSEANPDEKEKAECANHAYEYAFSRQEELAPCAIRTEEKVDPGKVVGVKNCKGTADLIVCASNVLEVADLKTGRVHVEPDASQLGLYLLGALNDYWPDRTGPIPFQQAITTVIQPRAPHSDGPIRHKAWNMDEILALEQQLVAASDGAFSENPTFTPGEVQCRFCPAKGSCRAHFEWMSRKLFDVLPGAENLSRALDLGAMQDVQGQISSEDLADFLDAAPLLENLIEAMREEAKARMSHRLLVPRWKLIRRTASPKWKSEDPKVEMPKMLRKLKLKKAQIFNDSLKTPLQVMKANLTEEQSARVADLWHRPDGAVAVVPETDPGQDIMTAGADFTPITGEINA